MATVNLEIEGTQLRVAVPRALARAFRKTVSDFTVADDSPLGFVLRQDGRHRRRFVLLDRCGFRLGSASGPDAAISILVQHLAAFRRPPRDTVQFRLRTLVRRDGAILCLYPVLYMPPADEQSLADGGYLLVHRLDAWLQVSPPRVRIIDQEMVVQAMRSGKPPDSATEMRISALALPHALRDSAAARSVALIGASVGGSRREIFEVATHIAANVPAVAIDLHRPLGPQLPRE